MNEIDQLQAQIWEVFEGELGLKPPDADTDLFGSGIMDSLTFVNLLVCLERRFGLTVRLESLELENFQSITRIARFIADEGATVTHIAGERDAKGKRATG